MIRLVALTEFHLVLTGVPGGWARQFLFKCPTGFCWEEETVPDHFAESRTVFIPKTSGIDDNGRIIRSPDALRPLTLCNCDCKLLTSAICRGLHWYTMRCIHPSQRCISSRQMTDNIFEIETTALAHVACTPQESGILIDRCCCCLSQTEDNFLWPEVLDKAVQRAAFFFGLRPDL